MDANERFKSDLGNDTHLENGDRDKVTGIQTSDLRQKNNDKPIVPRKKPQKS
jgi:hypothetical protein